MSDQGDPHAQLARWQRSLLPAGLYETSDGRRSARDWIVDLWMTLIAFGTRLLRGQSRPPEVIVLTTFDADELVLRALRAGAAGFLLKDTPPAEIVRAIGLVHAGEGMLSPAVTRRLIAMVAGGDEEGERRERAKERLAALSEREHEVALAVGRGCSNADIAAELHMSVATVKAHVSRLFAKLEVENRVPIALLVQDAAAS
jgi:DNA-binding NarL/FixJ family response regulator